MATLAEIEIPLEPHGQMRAKVSARGGFAKVYKCAKQRDREEKFIAFLLQQWTKPPLSGPIGLELIFEFTPPKSASKKTKAAMLAGEIHHTTKPDLDNLEKFVKDCFNEIVWLDDRQVWFCVKQKRYGERNRVVAVLMDSREGF